ncbi:MULTISPECIES: hypothetical protein [unclassified Pseudoalteromonas]|uniref:hypothetical protein n=1 Tax=unclassified Pseudoalteromonas TaxID=194690 RepID=UPI00148736C7|nr:MULTISPECIES: hypothetical protein [unclassified Pseudoalteromonas]
MNASQAAWQRGKSDYKLGISYLDNPYKDLDADLADDWLEGWQMASYKERQKSTSKQIN